MSDAAMELRIGRLEDDVDGLKHWQNGNGKPGAAAMLIDHEKRIAENEAKDEEQDKALACIDRDKAVEKATEHAALVKAFEEAMSKRGKTREGKIRALGPWFAAAMGLIIALLPYILKAK